MIRIPAKRQGLDDAIHGKSAPNCVDSFPLLGILSRGDEEHNACPVCLVMFVFPFQMLESPLLIVFYVRSPIHTSPRYCTEGAEVIYNNAVIYNTNQYNAKACSTQCLQLVRPASEKV